MRQSFVFRQLHHPRFGLAAPILEQPRPRASPVWVAMTHTRIKVLKQIAQAQKPTSRGTSYGTKCGPAARACSPNSGYMRTKSPLGLWSWPCEGLSPSVSQGAMCIAVFRTINLNGSNLARFGIL